MLKALLLLLFLTAAAPLCAAQASGNVAYGQSNKGADRAEQRELAKRNAGDVPSQTSMWVEASVLMNVRADEHVAVFGVMQECAAVPECDQKMDAAVRGFTDSIRQLGVAPDDVFVDFVAQNKIYGYELAERVAREKLAGFEMKKNVAVRYTDRLLLDRLVTAASRANIFDLIKVDYVVRDTAAAFERLEEEAARVVKQKVARHERLYGVRLRQPPQIFADRPSIYYPTEMYDSYTAAETENISQPYYDRQQYTVQHARKSRTFYFNALNGDNFDRVINPVVVEPVVQFTLYLKLKFEIEQPKPEPKARRLRRR